jgi:hypothetical protein
VKVDNTFYRKYDAQLGRFTGIDIRAEESYGMSVYNYGANNPVLYNDPMGDKFGMEKGPDGNYHTEWVTRMMWNDMGFYQEMGQVPMMNYGNGGSYGVYYNAHGVSSTTILSMMSFGERLQQRLNGDLGFFCSSSRGMYFLNNRNNQDNYNGNRVDRKDEGVITASKFVNLNDLGGMNGQGSNDWAQNAQTFLGAFDMAHGAKEELINYAAKSTPSINELKYVKAIKVASKGLFIAQAGISIYQAGNAFYTKNDNKWGVAGKAGLDILIGAVSVWGGPVGWLVGGIYFIGDSAGWWGNWGQPAPSTRIDVNRD